MEDPTSEWNLEGISNEANCYKQRSLEASMKWMNASMQAELMKRLSRRNTFQERQAENIADSIVVDGARMAILAR